MLFVPFKSFFSSVYPLQWERWNGYQTFFFFPSLTAVAAAGTSALTCLWKHTQFSTQASWSVVSRVIIQLCPILRHSSGLRLTLKPIITTFSHSYGSCIPTHLLSNSFVFIFNQICMTNVCFKRPVWFLAIDWESVLHYSICAFFSPYSYSVD